MITLMTTLAHLDMMCTDDLSFGSLLSARNQQQQRSSRRMKFEGCSSTVSIEPFCHDLASLLHKCPRTEVLLSSLVQEFVIPARLPHETKACELFDKPNEKLLEALHADMAKTNDREIPLGEEECNRLTSCIVATEGNLLYPFRMSTTFSWRCYVKKLGHGIFTVILIPASYQSLKTAVCPETADGEAPGLTKLSSQMPAPLTDSPEHTPGRQDSFSDLKGRKRTQSIDNSEASAEGGRLRRNSMSSGRGLGTAAHMEEVTPQRRPRTQTFSQPRGGLGRGGRSGRREAEGAKEPQPLATVDPKKKVTGSLAIPIIVFDVQSSALRERMFDEESNASQSSHVDLRIGDDLSDNLSNREVVVKVHRRYSKSFVAVVFSSLQHGLPVHGKDTQQAVDFCDEEIAIDINLQRLFKCICVHVEKGSSSQCTCIDLDMHKMLKKKFSDVTRLFFDPIPADKNFLYYKADKNLGNSRGDASGRMRRDTRDTAVSTSHIQSVAGVLEDPGIVLRSDMEDLRIAAVSAQQSRVGDALMGTPGPSGVATPSLPAAATVERGSTSVLSHLDSDPSGSSFSVDVLDDDVPLFLQLSATVKSRSLDLDERAPLNAVPTCAKEVIQKFPSLDNLDLTTDDLQIFLELIFITLPFEQKAVEPSNDEGGNINPVEEEEEVEEAVTSYGIQALVEHHKQAVEHIRSEIEWSIEDEWVFALIKSGDITEEILAKVVMHISGHPNKPGCSTKSSELNFVLNQTATYELFSALMDGLEVDGFFVVTCGQFKYLITRDDGNAPAFWMIIRCTTNRVEVFFHYREGQHNKVSI